MNIHKFYPAQEPQPEELNAAFEDTVNNLANRVTTLIQPGIVPADKLYSETGDPRWKLAGTFQITRSKDSRPGANNFGIDIGHGIAYDKDNNRICICEDSPYDTDQVGLTNTVNAVDSLGNAIPKSTGNLELVLPPSATRHIYIRYLHVVNSNTPGGGDPVNNYTVDPDTGQVDYVHYVDGYKVFFSEDQSTDPLDIYLGTVVTGDSEVNAIYMDLQRQEEVPSYVVITGVNDAIDFTEDNGSGHGPELNATLKAGTYVMGASAATPDSLCREIKTALEVANGGVAVYSVDYDYSTRKITVTRSSGEFIIKWDTGSRAATSARILMGWATPAVDTDSAIQTTSTSVTAVAQFTPITGSQPGFARTYANISSALVHATVPDGTTVVPPIEYTTGQTITVDEHIRSIADTAAVSPSNPHGITMDAIPGLNERFGPYSDNPENFTANCIVDNSVETSINPGALFCELLPSGHVRITKPEAGTQFAYVSGSEYTRYSNYFSEVINGSVMDYDLTDPTDEYFTCEFQTAPRTDIGYYYICLQPYTDSLGNSGLRAVAVYTGTNSISELENILLLEKSDGSSYVPSSDLLPLAVVRFSNPGGINQIIPMDDPQTGRTGVYLIDVRRFGHIGNAQLSYERRYYTGSGSSRTTDVVNIDHNVRVLRKDLEVYGTTSGGTAGGNVKVIRGTLTMQDSFVSSDNGNLTIKNRTDASDYATVFLPGEIKMYAGPSAPDGWFLCDGSTKDQATYARLYAVIGSLYNNGSEPAGHFRLPDLCGRVPVGAGTSSAGGTLTPRSLASSGGEEAHQLTIGEMPSHTHNVSIPTGNVNGGWDSFQAGDNDTAERIQTTQSTGGNQAHNNMQPFLAVNYIIKY